MTLTIEIAQLPTAEATTSATRILVQDGGPGTPYQQATLGDVFLDIVDEIGTGTIVAGDVVISGGTADLDVLHATVGTIDTATIGAGTATLSVGSIQTLTVGGTLTATLGAITTLNAGTVDISSGKASLSSVIATTGTIGTLTATTGTITSLNTGTIAIGGGTGTLSALTVTGLASTGTVTATTGTIATAVITTGTVGTLTSTIGTITDLTTTTLAASGTATIGTAAFGTSTVAKADPRWGLVDGVTTDKDGYPLGYFGPDGTFYAGAINSGGGNASSDIVTTDIVTTDTLIVAGTTATTADPRWGLVGGLEVDASGYPLTFRLPTGERIIEAQTINTLTLGNEPTASSHAATKKYVDEAAGGTSGAYTGIELEARNAAALAQSMAVRDNTNATIATPCWVYSHLIHYGQSFALGFGSSGLISTTAGPDGTFQFGTRPANTVATDEFVQSGTAAITDLTITAGAEVPAIGMVNFLRRAQLFTYNLASDTTRQLVVNACGKGGTALEDLSKGATPTEYYGQITDLMDKAHTAAGGSSYGVAAVCLLQGEANYSLEAADNTEAGYKATLEAFATDVATDAITETTQTYPPGLFLCQTSSVWDAYGGDVSSIGNAQLSASLDNPNIYLIGPYYAYPDDGSNHLTDDGYRWLGEQFSKVIYRVLIQGMGWEPCHIKAAWFRGDKVLLEYHVPYPPLQVQPAYIETTPTTFTNRGYRIGDDAGAISISSIEVNAATVVITMARETSTAANPWIQYAGKATYDGAGNICDSDPTISYALDTTTSAPYPLWNWAVGQRIDIEEDA